MLNNCRVIVMLYLLFGLTAAAQQSEPETQDETQNPTEAESADAEKKPFRPSERIKADDQIYFPVDI